MGDMKSYFQTMTAERRRIRAEFGRACPRCQRQRPKADPTMLLPGQRCRIDNYIDKRDPKLMEPGATTWHDNDTETNK